MSTAQCEPNLTQQQQQPPQHQPTQPQLNTQPMQSNTQTPTPQQNAPLITTGNVITNVRMYFEKLNTALYLSDIELLFEFDYDKYISRFIFFYISSNQSNERKRKKNDV